MLWGILRGDGLWYAGAVDRQPQFSARAGRYRRKDDADQRAAALEKLGHQVEVLPIVTKGS